MRLKLTELFTDVDWLGFRSSFDFKHIETNCLGKRTALTDGNNITFLDTETRGNVSSNVLVSLFKTLVLLDEMQVISTDNDGSLHLGGQDYTLKDTTTDRDVSSEWAFLIYISAVNGRLWGLEAKTDVLVKTWSLLLSSEFLRCKEDTVLLLKGFFVLCIKKDIVNIRSFFFIVYI